MTGINRFSVSASKNLLPSLPPSLVFYTQDIRIHYSWSAGLPWIPTSEHPGISPRCWFSHYPLTAFMRWMLPMGGYRYALFKSYKRWRVRKHPIPIEPIRKFVLLWQPVESWIKKSASAGRGLRCGGIVRSLDLFYRYSSHRIPYSVQHKGIAIEIEKQTRNRLFFNVLRRIIKARYFVKNT